MITQPVGDVVRSKDIQELVSVPASASVADAVELMTRKGVGAVIISSRPDSVEGIFTERDVMSRVVGEARDPKLTPISTVMSPDVRRVDASVSVEETLRLMVVHGHRHLLVEAACRAGLVSIRDLMHWIILPTRASRHEGRGRSDPSADVGSCRRSRTREALSRTRAAR
jgi:CBS domain-containing protein